MTGYIEDEIKIRSNIMDLVKPHKNLITDKIAESLSEFDPYYDELYFYLREELEDEEGNFDEDKVNEIRGEYSSYGHDSLVENYYTINEDEMYIDTDNCELDAGEICIAVPFVFNMGAFADEYI